MERSAGLPSSLLQKAEQVRLEDGPAKIEASIADVQRLAQQDTKILDEVRLAVWWPVIISTYLLIGHGCSG
jgi:hypothetical protein